VDVHLRGLARRFLATWLRALRWQRLPAFQKLGRLLTRHLDGILNYCHEKVPFGTVEAINGNILGDAAPGARVPGSRVPGPQGPTRDRHPPSSGRMNTSSPTHSGEERFLQCSATKFWQKCRTEVPMSFAERLELRVKFRPQ
jgi:hypothetical protein